MTDDASEREKVRAEAKAAQARIEQRRRATDRVGDREAAPQPFRRGSAEMKRLIDDAAAKSGFVIDWEKREVKERGK
jgi:hypothetical protein